MNRDNPDLNKLFPYFRNSMNYLLKEGEQFAHKYPAIAKELNFSANKISDPHVKRMLEAFAFFDARLQYQIDDQISDISNHLLTALYPQFTAPIPSCTIVQFHKMKNISQKESITIPKNTQIKTKNSQNQACTFSITSQLNLSDLKIHKTHYIKEDQTDLPVKHTFMLGVNVENLQPNKDVNVFINSDAFSAFYLYENILAYEAESPTPIFIADYKHKLLQKEPIGYIYPKGFDQDDSLFDIPKYCNDIHRNLLEYSSFPEKFLFLNMKFNDFIMPEGNVQLLIPLSKKANPSIIHLNNHILATNCAPAINLFTKNSEPLIVNHETESYKLIPHKNEESFEIHTVKNIFQYDNTQPDNKINYNQYFGFHNYNHTNRSWYHYRKSSLHGGSDVFVAFIDENMKNISIDSSTIYANLLCTNRNEAEHIKVNNIFQVNKIDGVYCKNIIQPTKSVQLSHEGKAQWSIISNLSLNHIDLSINNNNIQTLQKMLAIYSVRKDIKHHGKSIVKIDYTESIGRAKHSPTSSIPKIIFDITFDDYTAEIFLLSMLLSNILLQAAPFNNLVDITVYKEYEKQAWKKVSLSQ
ncbi:type VI secretion system baseplate subunit TssF [Candidatus Cytomitobacter primus]|nr:type VI secretion system baseplate subunit TssF [Candidatus Cytomitobacter primus]